MRFLLQLFLRWVNWFGTLLQGGAASANSVAPLASMELAAGELVARFIYSRSQMSPLNSRPKPGAFDPSPHNELSVVHSSALQDREVWEIGIHTLGTQPGRDKIHGRADVPVRALTERKLRAILDDNPFKRHTSVIGWPAPADPDERKQQRKQLCLELSQDPDIRLIIPESPIIRAS